MPVSLAEIARTYRNIKRLRDIAAVLARHGFGEVAERVNLRRFIPFLRRKSPEELGRTPLPRRAAMVLQDLGSTFVKLGQMLSTRPDLIPEPFVEEFSKLQDHVRPFPYEEAEAVVEEELKAPLDDLFAEFEREPAASGSIAQVHRAVLHSGERVMVKVKRPGIDADVRADLSILHALAGLAEAHVTDVKPYRPVMIADEFARAMTRELDFVTEASSTSNFSDSLKDESRLVVPRVYWKATGKRVLTLGRLDGTPLSNIEELRRRGVDQKKLARDLSELFMRQFFETGLFHADPHPGNILVLDGGRVGLIDFGCSGHLTEETKSQLAATLLGLARGDMELVTNVYADHGVLSDATDVEALRGELLELIDRYYGTPARHIGIGPLFSDFTSLARRYEIRLPRDFVLLGRSLVIISGIVRTLDPDLDVASIASPYAKKLILRRFSVSSMIREGVFGAYAFSTLLHRLPSDLKAILRKVRRGEMRVQFKHEGLEGFAGELGRSSSRLSFSIIIAALIVSSSLIIMKEGMWPAMSAFGFDKSTAFGKLPLLGLAGYLLSFFLALRLLWDIWRSGRLYK